MKKLILSSCAVLTFTFAWATATPEGRTASLYVQDGLVAHWDGIENAGVGTHDDATTVWKDLTGNGCGALTNVTATDAITYIGGEAFRGCGNLVSFAPLLPKSLATLENLAFYGDSRLTGTLEVGTGGGPLTINGSSHFNGTAITNAVFGSGLTTIPWAFTQNAALKTVSMDDAITIVGGHAFEGCGSLKTVRLSNKVEEIQEWAFGSCSALTTIEPFLPATLKTLSGNYVFYWDYALSGTVTLENRRHQLSVASSYGTFFQCGTLGGVVLGREIESTAGEFLSGCTGVRRLYLKTRTAFGGSSFNDWSARWAIVYVPRSSAEWMADLANPEICTPWAEVHRDLQDEFHDRFPGEKNPYGLLTGSVSSTYAPPNQWVTKWNPGNAGLSIIVR